MSRLLRAMYCGSLSLARLCALTATVTLVTSCSVMDSTLVQPADIPPAAYLPGGPVPCRSALGSYALPKAILTITVSGTIPTAAAGNTIAVDTIRRADPSLVFCLDHLADPFADHGVRIIKSSGQAAGLGYDTGTVLAAGPKVGDQAPPAGMTLTRTDKETKVDAGYGTQLLQWVVSNTVDQTAYILRSLTRAAFIAISGKPGFTPVGRGGEGEVVPLAVLDYDPFDIVQSATVNAQLRRLGYCLVLEGFTFDTHRTNLQQYCNAPSATYETVVYKTYVEQQREPPPKVRGLAYRPRASYLLSIYQKPDVHGRHPWRLWKSQYLSLENISPVVSVGVTRSLFASRKAVLKFTEGTLVAMCLVKTSELQAAVTVPYEIVRSIVALPTAVFEVKIGNANDNKALVQAESALVNAQKDYLNFLKSKDVLQPDATKKDTVTQIPSTFARPAAPASTDPGAILRASPSEIEYARNSALAQICQNPPTVFE